MSRHINVKSRVKLHEYSHILYITNYLDIILTLIRREDLPMIYSMIWKNGNPWKYQINTRDTFRCTDLYA